MSRSQRSDFTSSLYGGDLVDLSYLSTGQITPSISQHTIDSSFRRPDDPLLLPSSLKRVGRDRRKGFVLYETMPHNDFVDWWLETDYGRKSKITSFLQTEVYLIS